VQPSSALYNELLDDFLSNCLGIRYLQLLYFKFDADFINESIVDGIKRLKQFSLHKSSGGVGKFFEMVQPENLESFSYVNDYAYRTIATITKISPLLTSIKIDALCPSFLIIYIIRDCPYLERISFNPGPHLQPETTDAISLLPNLKYLDIDRIEVGAASSLSKCTSLKHLRINGRVEMDLFLPKIGQNLTSLSLTEMSKMEVDIKVRLIVKCCPNLESLSLKFRACFDLVSEEVAVEVKKGLKRLAKFQINGNAVRLGTDWDGWL
jgi:hypothetical protein